MNPIVLQNFRIQIGQTDDIGNGYKQQDAAHVIIKPELGCIIFAVADGHGYETGHIASNACIKAVTEYTEANLEELVGNTLGFLDKCFAHAQLQIRNDFIEHYTNDNCEVDDVCDVLIKRRLALKPVDAIDSVFQTPKESLIDRFNKRFSHISGGSMLTIGVLRFSETDAKLYIGNVGDCDALLCTKTPIIQKDILKYELDAATGATVNPETCEQHAENPQIALGLTCDHSPMNPNEYMRARHFRPSHADSNRSELLFIYDDTNVSNKHSCESVFLISNDGMPTIRDDVNYYHKNVNGERATYVTVPGNAGFRDAVASARAMGDFGIASYGVVAKPEIQSIDLNALFKLTDIACIVAGSDGVWDVWKQDHVSKFVMDPSCLDAIEKDTAIGAQRVAKSFMVRNRHYAQQHFRGGADNAICVVIYIKPV